MLNVDIGDAAERGPPAELALAARAPPDDPDEELRRFFGLNEVYAPNGPRPVETPERPPPTWTLAARGPPLTRIPRLDSLILTPGKTFTLIPTAAPSLRLGRTVPPPGTWFPQSLHAPGGGALWRLAWHATAGDSGRDTENRDQRSEYVIGIGNANSISKCMNTINAK